MYKTASITLFVVLLTVYPDGSEAVLASTWDYCNCRFDEWEPWQDCTSTCFGRQLRTRSVWLTNYVGCEVFTDCASNDEGSQYQDCNKVCHNGGNLAGSSCSCTAAYYGQCCTSIYDCGVPDPLQNGEVTYTATTYGSVTTYSCHQGYNMTGGDVTRTCLSGPSWSGMLPSCAYAQHCSSGPCQNEATCVDHLGYYTCVCQPGWSGANCENDVQPPVYDSCHGDIYVNATEHTVDVSWVVPTFSDPMNTELIVTKNYPSPAFTFPWGDFTVQYVATKPSNGLQTECAFQIHVRPTPCAELNTPTNGAVVCNGWQTDYGRFCMIACLQGYTIDPALSYDTWFVCGASGNWIASDPLPDCTVSVVNAPDNPYQPEYNVHTITSCTDVTNVKSLYISKLQEEGSFSEFCSKYPDECSVNNVNVHCT